jgi:hypothetical protein
MPEIMTSTLPRPFFPPAFSLNNKQPITTPHRNICHIIRSSFSGAVPPADHDSELAKSDQESDQSSNATARAPSRVILHFLVLAPFQSKRFGGKGTTSALLRLDMFPFSINRVNFTVYISAHKSNRDAFWTKNFNTVTMCSS